MTLMCTGVHASNQPMDVEVINSSGTRTNTMVKAFHCGSKFDPLAVNGALMLLSLRISSKTKMYG